MLNAVAAVLQFKQHFSFYANLRPSMQWAYAVEARLLTGEAP